MKVLILIYGTLFLGIMSGSAKEENMGKRSSDASSLLWKITGNGLSQPSYLFGTIHLICPDDYLWTPVMQAAFDSCNTVAFELDMDDPALQTAVSSGMRLHDGKQLKDFFTPEEYSRLATFSEDSLGIPLQTFQDMQPFALFSMLSMKAIECQFPDSYEGNLAQMAGVDDKPIVGLETADDQLAILSSLNQDSTAQQLLQMVGDWSALQKQYAGMINSYKQQDLPALYQSIISSPDFKDNLDTLLFGRNIKWVPEIERLVHQQSVFIAVGAGHLWGDLGVIELLRRQGYRVQPVH